MFKRYPFRYRLFFLVFFMLLGCTIWGYFAEMGIQEGGQAEGVAILMHKIFLVLRYPMVPLMSMLIDALALFYVVALLINVFLFALVVERIFGIVIPYNKVGKYRKP
mgnify:CR=1 FL=1